MPVDRRSRKRLANRQSISDAATRLFFERGFDHVTVDEIAAAADVGRMTVFNHFPRKEDLFFDRDEELREIVRQTLRQRDPGMPPVEALRRRAHQLATGAEPLVRFGAGSSRFIETIEGSETLKARARAMCSELAATAAAALAESAGTDPEDPAAKLAGALLVATWTVAFTEAHRIYGATREGDQAKAVFLQLVDQGNVGVQAALSGTAYA